MANKRERIIQIEIGTEFKYIIQRYNEIRVKTHGGALLRCGGHVAYAYSNAADKKLRKGESA